MCLIGWDAAEKIILGNISTGATLLNKQNI